MGKEMDGKRYRAQMRLLEIGKEGQQKLLNSRVLIVGCGAIGSPIAMILAGAGIGNLIIADFDTIDLSNLHRQFFYNENELGESKVKSLEKRIRNLNSSLKIEAIDHLVTRRILDSIEGTIDVIIDAADNPATTYLLEEYCRSKCVPLCTSGVAGWHGQIYSWLPGCLTFSEIVPPPDQNNEYLPCSIEGILGATSSTVASIQAAEAIKILLNLDCEKGKLITIDLLSGDFKTFWFPV